MNSAANAGTVSGFSLVGSIRSSTPSRERWVGEIDERRLRVVANFRSLGTCCPEMDVWVRWKLSYLSTNSPFLAGSEQGLLKPNLDDKYLNSTLPRSPRLTPRTLAVRLAIIS